MVQMTYESLQQEKHRAPGSGQPQHPQASQRNIRDHQIPQQTVQGSPSSCGLSCPVLGCIWDPVTNDKSASLDSVYLGSVLVLLVGIFAYYQEVKSTNIMSEPQSCSCDFTHGNPLETKSIGLSSTMYVKGTATGTVSNTGNGTITGQIASLASGTGSEKAPLAIEIEHFVPWQEWLPQQHPFLHHHSVHKKNEWLRRRKMDGLVKNLEIVATFSPTATICSENIDSRTHNRARMWGPKKILEKCSTIIINVLEQPLDKGTAKAFHRACMELAIKFPETYSFDRYHHLFHLQLLFCELLLVIGTLQSTVPECWDQSCYG
ncbi:hypothetical protein HPG69_017969 [Diceros bicornis minor]|uniref:Uncharacterized protein n=1 Tax=Diceros bicornis minor TaxID=77932 RepID=A0A7J7F4J0_DICBM|nr:hypothetical protein HPG69_017969 [Diceros bicornis minor]